MAKSRTQYGRKPSRSIESMMPMMSEMKRGELASGRPGKKATGTKQAVTISLSEARRSAAKVPRKAARTSTGRSTSARSGRPATKRSGRTTARGATKRGPTKRSSR